MDAMATVGLTSAAPAPQSGSVGVGSGGGGTGASNEEHSLTFRVMRLARPEFKPSFATLKCEMRNPDENVSVAPVVDAKGM